MAGTRKSQIGRHVWSRLLQLETLEQRRLLAGDAAALELSRFESAVELEEFLVDDALQRWDGFFGQPAWPMWWGGPIVGCPECEFVVTDFLAPGAPPDHSDTNTQVAGVDESDLVETDGDYLYMLSGQELIIVDAWEPEDLQVVSRVDIDGQPIGQFLKGDRLAVISNTHDYVFDGPWFGGPFIDMALVAPHPDYWSPPRTKLTVLDVADRQNPKIVQTTELDGAYVSSRAIEDHVYLISNSDFGLPAPEIICAEDDAAGDEQPDSPWEPTWDESCHYESQETYLQRVEGHAIELALPHYSAGSDDVDAATTGLVSEATDIFRPFTDVYQNLISVSVFNMAGSDPGPVSSTSVPTTYSTTVYASMNSLYLTNPDWGMSRDGGEASSILKFDIAEGGSRVDLVAVGQVPGRLLNSFSMDEYNDTEGNEYLRIATTSGWGEDTNNRVYVLQQTDTELDILGRTPRLAPGEQIFSVRFAGLTGYVVTFRQTDPLFTIDLSVPGAPQVMGDLHITGFSNYLQPVSEDFLIGLGRDADPNTGRAQELQISLFDVSDLSKPALADRYSFNVPDWAWTEAISDHHAVGYYPEHEVLAIPVSNGGGWVTVDRDGDGRVDFETYRPRTDLYVFQLDLPDEGAETDASITFLGTIRHDADVRRSVRIDSFLYAIAAESVSVHPIGDPQTETAHLHVGQEDVGVPLFETDHDNPLVSVAVNTPERAAPQVVRIAAAGSQWDYDVINYLDVQANGLDVPNVSSVLPFSEVNEIKVQFSEDVMVAADDLRLLGENVDRYPIQNFSFDVDTFTAVWTLSQSIVSSDTIEIRLAGVKDLAGNRLDGDVNGQAGGVFRHAFSVLPGDVDRDGRVGRADLASARTLATTRVGDTAYSFFHDVDGSGQIDEADFQMIENRAGTMLPGLTPLIPGDANQDGTFDSSDLTQVFQRGEYEDGIDGNSTWDEGDWNRDGDFNSSDLVRAFQTGHYEAARGSVASEVAAAVDWLFSQSTSRDNRSARVA